MYESKHIKIPARPGAEGTTLHIKLVAENQPSLTKKPYIFILPGRPGANHSH